MEIETVPVSSSSCNFTRINIYKSELSGDPVVKNLPSKAEDSSLIPVKATKIPHAQAS